MSFNLLKDIYLLRKKFPKTEKYTLDGQLKQTALEMMLNIIQTGRAKKQEKIIPLESAIKKNGSSDFSVGKLIKLGLSEFSYK